MAKIILLLVDFLRAGSVDHIGDVPIRIFLGKASNAGIIIPGPEIVGAGFSISVFAAVAEGVDICGVGIQFIAEGIVVVGTADSTCGAGKLHHIAMSVVEIVAFRTGNIHEDRVDAPQIAGGNSSILDLAYHIFLVQNIVTGKSAGSFAGSDALRIIGVGGGNTVRRVGNQLVNRIILESIRVDNIVCSSCCLGQ